MGNFLIILGVILIISGSLFHIFGNISEFPKLPGDIYIEKENFTFYFPLVTSLLLSLIITLILWFLNTK